MMAHPGLVLFAAALVSVWLRGRARQAVVAAGAAAALASAAALPAEGLVWAVDAAGYRLELVRVDPLARVFTLIFTLITAIAVLFALHVRRATEHASALTYAGAAIGVTLAGDWITAFVWWELMAAASLALIWHGRTPRTGGAGFRYLLVHAAGGSLLLAGLVVHVAAGGDPSFASWRATWSAGWSLPAALMLAGVAINAAIPPLHAWLTDAYPEASVSGTVFLSAFTTKTAVYLLIRAFPESDLLLWAGAGMALYGAVYALIENDIRRLLAYSIVSQVGYMVAAVGMGTAMALNGAAAHAFSHILYKALLLMSAGAVLAATGRSRLSELGGLAARMPITAACYIVGALAISAAPLFNGFVSKSMIVTAAAEGGWPWAELLLTLASVGSLLHTGLRLPYYTFFGPDRGIVAAPVPRNMTAAMLAAAALCLAIGVYPGWLYARLPFPPVEYHPYTVDHVVATVQLLAGGGAAFWLLRRRLAGAPALTLDTDWFYRRPFPRAMDAVVAAAGGIGEAGRQAARSVAGLLGRVTGFTSSPGGVNRDAYRRPLGRTVSWVLALVAVLALLGWL